MTAEPTWTEKNRSAARRIAAAIAGGQVARGDVSALRRARPGDLGGPAVWKLAVRFLEPDGLLHEEGPHRDAMERRWTALLAGMASAKSSGKGRQLGSALADAKVSEARVLRLLRARGVALLRVVRTVVHQLDSSGTTIDWGELAELVLSEGKPEWQEAVRRRVARAYYRTTPAETAATD